MGRLEIIYGRAGSGKTTNCLKNIAEQMKKKPFGTPLIMLVPEHDTFRVEKLLAEMMGTENGLGFFRAYVVGFRRLAHQVIKREKISEKPKLSELGRQLIIKRILLENEARFQTFGSAIRQQSFAGELSTVIGELKSYGVIVSYKKYKKEKNDNSLGRHLVQKLDDLEIVYDAYDSAQYGDGLPQSDKLYSDDEELMTELLSAVPKTALFSGAEVWVDGFTFFEPLELDILAAILARGGDMHITLTLDENEPAPDNATGNISSFADKSLSIFSRAKETLKKLEKFPLAIKRDYGIDLDISYRQLNILYRFTDGYEEYGHINRAAFRRLENDLFSLNQLEKTTKEDKIRTSDCLRLVEASGRRQELELMAADIRRICREKNFSYKDIGILIRDWSDYGFLLPLVLADYDIPYYCDKKLPANHHPLAELILACLAVAFGKGDGYYYEAVFRALKTGFFSLTLDEIDELENYVLAFGIKGKKWQTDEPWPYYRQRWRENDDEGEREEAAYLERINRSRDKAARPLRNFTAKIKGKKDEVPTATKMVTALYDLLIELNVPQQLEIWAKEEERRGFHDKARHHQMIWDGVIRLFDEIVRIIGDEPLEKEKSAACRTLSALIADGLGRINFSIIPPGLDYVSVASFDSNSLDDMRAIYILGANEGIMPKSGNENSLLSDDERDELEKRLGIELPRRTRLENSLAERYTLYRGFTRMRDYLWISYAMSDEEGTGLRSAPLINRLEMLLPALKDEKLTVYADQSITFGKEEAKVGITQAWQLATSYQAVVKLAGKFRDFRRDILQLETAEKKEMEKNKADLDAIAANDYIWPAAFSWISTADGQLNKPGCISPQELLKLVLDGALLKAEEKYSIKNISHFLYAHNGKIYGSVSALEAYATCPFKYFAKYGLGLKEREEYAFAATDKGIILHEVMKHFMEEIRAGGKENAQQLDARETAEELMKIALQGLKKEILLADGTKNFIFERLIDTAQVSIEELKKITLASDFLTVALEQDFGYGRDMEALILKIDEKIHLNLRGTIDRIDAFRDEESGNGYVIVIDYKTGNKKIAAADIYDGTSLQLLTYLIIACHYQLAGTKNIQLIPAGMYYCALKNPVIDLSPEEIETGKAKEKLEKMMSLNGWTLDDKVIQERIMKGEAAKNKVPSRSDTARSKEEWQGLIQFLKNKLADIGKNIIRGNLKPEPYVGTRKKACDYCNYKEVCGFDLKVPGYRYRDKVKGKPAEILAKMTGIEKERSEIGGR